MDDVKLRAWWSHRQGLDGSLDSPKSRIPRIQALKKAGAL